MSRIAPTVPGIGKILSLVILYEIHDIRRFPTVQDFASYARLVKCAKESAGKRTGTSGKKIGNAHLKWAFSEAAVLSLRQNPKAQAWLKKTASKHGKPKALSILAHKLGRTVYYLLLRDEAFDMHMDKPEPARHLMWRDHVSQPRPRSRQPARLDWMAISLRLKSYAEESQRDLLLPRARRLTGERSALSPTLDWAGMRVPMGS